MPDPKPAVVKLVPYRARCNNDSINLLKQALKEARRGDIEQIGLALVRRNGAVNTAFSEGEVGPLLGAATLLVHRLGRSADE